MNSKSQWKPLWLQTEAQNKWSAHHSDRACILYTVTRVHDSASWQQQSSVILEDETSSKCCHQTNGTTSTDFSSTNSTTAYILETSTELLKCNIHIYRQRTNYIVTRTNLSILRLIVHIWYTVQENSLQYLTIHMNNYIQYP